MGVRLKVGFQPLKVISPTASWIRSSGFGGAHRYMRCKYGELIFDQSCSIYARQFWVPNHSGEEKGITQTIMLSPNRPVGYLTHKCQTQAEKHKHLSFYVFGLTRLGIEPRPSAPRMDVL